MSNDYCFGSIPKTTQIVVWICIAHFWILICTIVYVELEGVTKNRHHYSITDESDLAIDVLSGLHREASDSMEIKVAGGIKADNIKEIRAPGVITEIKDPGDVTKIKEASDIITEIKKSRILREKFRTDYAKKLKTLKHWKIRNEFNDVSKVYVFTLLSHTTIGGPGTMYLQTWQSQLFYIFTMPIGVLSYCIMIHYIAAEMFEILAYAAVTIFQRPQLDWTVDQRELYEKSKVFLLACVLMVCTILMCGTIGLIAIGDYTAGVYHISNLMFTISCSDPLFPFKEYSHEVIAALLTFLVFFCMLIQYTVLYSVFIMFRYNGWSDVMVILFGESDELNDARTTDDILEFEEWKQHHHQQQQYQQHKQQQKQQRNAPNDGEFFILHPKVDLQKVQQTRKKQQQHRSSSETSSVSTVDDPDKHQITNSQQNNKRLEHVKPITISTAGHYVQPKQQESFKRLSSLSPAPDIKVTSPSPPTNHDMKDPFNDYANHSDDLAFSDATNVSLEDQKITQ